MPAGKRGPRTAGEDTRALIVDAALQEFTEKGFERASIRAIARRAGVDPALVHHYFDGKAELFDATMTLGDFDAKAVAQEILDGGTDAVGYNMARVFLSIWDPPQGRAQYQGLILSTKQHGADRITAFLRSGVYAHVLAKTGSDRPELRTALMASALLGLGMARYGLELPPIVDADPELLAVSIGRVLQAYLEDPLPPATES